MSDEPADHVPQCNRWRGAIYWGDLPCNCAYWTTPKQPLTELQQAMIDHDEDMKRLDQTIMLDKPRGEK